MEILFVVLIKGDSIYCKDNLTDSNWSKLPGALKYVSLLMVVKVKHII